MAKFLIVDDEKIIREGISKMIERVMPGHHCILAKNGMTALKEIESYEFDIIISDIKMPVMDGMELAKELLTRKIHIPFIFLTGLEDFKLVQQALRYNVVDYLLKPISSSELKKVITINLECPFSNKGEEIPNHKKTILNKFEFELSNALECLNKESASEIIKRTLETINDRELLYQEIQRISNNFFIKRGIYGLYFSHFRKPVNDSQLINMLSDLIEQLKINKSDEPIIEIAKNYIKQNIATPPSLTEIAEISYFNPNYFSDYFKEKTGETFSDYLSRVRIEKAKELLKDTVIKVKDIAEKTGYHDVRYFRRLFKRTVGLNPNEYRKNQQLLRREVNIDEHLG